jgi:biopolymer transport protein ExbB/TolQ
MKAFFWISQIVGPVFWPLFTLGFYSLTVFLGVIFGVDNLSDQAKRFIFHWNRFVMETAVILGLAGSFTGLLGAFSELKSISQQTLKFFVANISTAFFSSLYGIIIFLLNYFLLSMLQYKGKPDEND